MLNAILLSLAALIAAAIIVIGCSILYLLSESQEHLASSRQHPMLTHVRGYV